MKRRTLVVFEDVAVQALPRVRLPAVVCCHFVALATRVGAGHLKVAAVHLMAFAAGEATR